MAVYTELATKEGKVLYVAFVKAALRQKRRVFTEVPNFSILTSASQAGGEIVK